MAGRAIIRSLGEAGCPERLPNLAQQRGIALGTVFIDGTSIFPGEHPAYTSAAEVSFRTGFLCGVPVLL